MMASAGEPPVTINDDVPYNLIGDRTVIKEMVLEIGICSSFIFDFFRLILFHLFLGSKKYPRFCCACHEINTAIVSAVANQKSLNTTVKKLSTYNKQIRRSIERSKPFRECKCRLSLEQHTRWSPQYLLLLKNKLAYDRNGNFSH
jgi:hypothetical protein